MPITRIVNECDAVNNLIDKRILHEMTGIKLDHELFNDDSSFEDDLSLMVDNLLGWEDRIRAIEDTNASATSQNEETSS